MITKIHIIKELRKIEILYNKASVGDAELQSFYSTNTTVKIFTIIVFMAVLFSFGLKIWKYWQKIKKDKTKI